MSDSGSLSVNGRCLVSEGSAGQAAALSECKEGSADQLWSFHIPGYVGICLRVAGGGSGQLQGNCFRIEAGGTWRITEDGASLSAGQLEGSPDLAAAWHSLTLDSRGTVLTAFFDGVKVGAAAATLSRTGRAALASGWNRAYFDGFSVAPASAESWTDLGAGCCSTLDSGRADALFDGVLDGGLAACQARCLLHDDCGYVMYGWSGSDWCVAWPQPSGCSSLDAAGQGHCGSRGDNGVHSYELRRGGLVWV